MNDLSAARLAKWPTLFFFLLGDAIFIGLAAWIMQESSKPLGHWHAAALVVCVAGGAWLSVLPFIWDAKAAVQIAEMETLSSVTAEIQNIQLVSTQIKSATAHWQFAQEQATKTVEAANGIAERMTIEAKSFTEFMQKANDSEKATLRLEVEKLRRAEGEWMQIAVRTLDHVYALHQAGVRSGQPGLIQQLASFQTACRDVARRIGLVPFFAPPGELFNEHAHQPVEEQATVVTAGAIVEETVATGYTYQGQLLRKAIVVIRAPAAATDTSTPAEPAAAPATDAPASASPAATDEPPAVEPRQPSLF